VITFYYQWDNNYSHHYYYYYYYYYFCYYYYHHHHYYLLLFLSTPSLFLPPPAHLWQCFRNHLICPLWFLPPTTMASLFGRIVLMFACGAHPIAFIDGVGLAYITVEEVEGDDWVNGLFSRPSSLS